MPTPVERIVEAATVALNEVSSAIGETEFAVGLAMRLRTLELDPEKRKEYLVGALSMLYDARDLIEQAMPREAVEEEQDG